MKFLLLVIGITWIAKMIGVEKDRKNEAVDEGVGNVFHPAEFELRQY